VLLHGIAVALQVMYGGSPQQMLDSLRSLMQSIMTMYKIARYYGTPQRMTTLFQKITNQMMRGCKESILAAGKIWDQEKTQLTANMKVCHAGTFHSCRLMLQLCVGCTLRV
jgi:dynein heavy chain